MTDILLKKKKKSENVQSSRPVVALSPHNYLLLEVLILCSGLPLK